MSVLGINCATEKLSLAVLNSQSHLLEKHWLGPTIKAENLLSYLDEILKETKTTIKDIEKIGIAIGPGAFTGLRLSLIMAKTICLERTIPLVPVSTLYGMAYQFKPTIRRFTTPSPQKGEGEPLAVDGGKIRIILDACRGEVSTALFDKDLNRLEEDHPAIRSEIKDDQDTYIIENEFPDAKAIAEIANSPQANTTPSLPHSGKEGRSTEIIELTTKEDILKLVPAYSHEARVNKSNKKELQHLKIGLNSP